MKTLSLSLKKNEEKLVPFVWIEEKETVKELTVNVSLDERTTLLIQGVFLGRGKSSLIFHTNVLHKMGKSKSRVEIRGVFFDHASFQNDALIRIEKGAKAADGYFSSKILLFDHAKGRSVPSLEINENEVKAGHASTVGRPDQGQLLYLRSRGISEKNAEKLLVQGFFEPILANFPKERRKRVKKQLQIALQ